MLNPKIVERYGERSKGALCELIAEMGKDLAAVCYAVPESSIWVDGVEVPSVISSSSDRVLDIRRAIYNFMKGHTTDNVDDFATICVDEREPEKGDIQLWL